MTKQYLLAPKELTDAEEWKAAHHCEISDALRHDRISFTPGSAFSICFSETGIGQAVCVRCACGEEKNVTDYSLW